MIAQQGVVQLILHFISTIDQIQTFYIHNRPDPNFFHSNYKISSKEFHELKFNLFGWYSFGQAILVHIRRVNLEEHGPNVDKVR